MTLRKISLLERSLRRFKEDSFGMVLKASIAVGAITGASYMIATTTVPSLVAGAIGAVVGAVGLPIAGLAALVLGTTMIQVVKNKGGYTGLLLATFAAGIVHVVLVKPVQTIGKKIGNLFSGRAQDASPAVTAKTSAFKNTSAQSGFNTEAVPPVASLPPKAEPPAHTPKI